jgi:hypothetical protein
VPERIVGRYGLRACGAKTQDEGEALLEAILQARGYMNADGMVTARLRQCLIGFTMTRGT